MTLEPSPIRPLAVQVISSSAVGVSVELQLRGMTAADFETDSELLDGFRSAVASASHVLDASQVVVGTFQDLRNATTPGLKVGFKVLLPVTVTGATIFLEGGCRTERTLLH